MVLFRLLSAQPQADGEHWKITGRWHQDVWHTDAYGQNPMPYQRSTNLSPRQGPPYPWRPSNTIWGVNDALFPLAAAFGLSIDLTSYPAILTASGATPVNTPQSTAPPIVPLQATTANTGGAIKPGTYFIAVTPNALNGPVSRFVTCVVPAGTNTNTITVSGVSWPGGAAAQPSVFAGTSSLNMGYLGTAPSGLWTGSSPDGNGNPTVFTITGVAGSFGLPDNIFQQFLVEATSIAYPGALLDTVTAVIGGTITLASGGSWTTNQWVNRVLALYYRPGSSYALAGNETISASAAATVTVPTGFGHTTFAVGDVVVIRTLPTSITSNTIGDSQMNLVAGSMVGNSVVIIAGTGAGQGWKTIASHTTGLGSSVLTINGSWDITPDATSVYLILAPSPSYARYSGTVTNDGTASVFGSVVSVAATARTAQSLYVVVSACDVNGNCFPARYQPAREVYLPIQALPNSSGYYAVPIVSGVATIDMANGGNQVIVLPNSGSLVTCTLGGSVPNAGTKLTLFVRTPASGTWQTPAFTGGANGFASDVAAGTRYSTTPVANNQDELVFTFHGAGSTVTLGSIDTGVIS